MNKQTKAKSQAELAKTIGVTPEHLNAVLRRRTPPSVSLAKKIEAKLGIPWQTWFRDIPAPAPQAPPVAADQPPEAA